MSTGMRARNVLFITADQWRGECLSTFGHPCLQTPNLDRLAADGAVYRRHYSQATPCGPGRASLYTGMYLHNHRSVVNGTPLDARHTNVALEARKVGLEPVLFGYTDVGADPRTRHPRDPVLQHHAGVLPGMVPVVWMKDECLAWLAHLRAKGYDFGAVGTAGNLALHDVFRPRRNYPGADARGATFAPALFAAEDSQAAFLTDEAMKYLSVRRGQPWFMHLSYLSPHPPFVAPAPYHAMYDPADVPAARRGASPEQEAAQHPFLEHFLYHQLGAGITFGWNAEEHHLHVSERDLRQARATYYGMMSEVDSQIGRLVDSLKASGDYERTLIVFTSDHGELLGDHWQFAKYGYFDQAFHIPLVIRDPDAAAVRGRVVDEFTENVDVMPTIVDWLGLDVPAQCDGESLLALGRGGKPPGWREEVHWEFDFRDFIAPGATALGRLTPDQRALTVIRDRRYKYVHFTAMPALFFDLSEDPGEFHDLSRDPGYRDLVLEYAQKMLSWRMNHAERVLANTRLTPRGLTEHTGPRR